MCQNPANPSEPCDCQRGQVNHVTVVCELQLAGMRTETLYGRQFRVIPAVLVRSQVLHNNLGRTFLPPEELTADWANEWNGIPVLVGPHPTVQGQPVSGRSPFLLNERGAGWIFATKAMQEAGPSRRLKAEVWLDESRASQVDGLAAVFAKLDAGEPVELSTGFPGIMERVDGAWQGEEYNIVMHPTGADHLVISTEMTGACSVADGCGLGVNQEAGRNDMDNERGSAGNDTPTQSVDGTAHPASDFAYVPDPQTPSTWKLPIFDAAHVRAALARLNQAQIPASALAEVKRKIKKAAAKFNVDASSLNEEELAEHERQDQPSTGWRKILARVGELVGKRAENTQAMQWEEMVARRVAREVEAQNAVPTSDRDRATAIQGALQANYGGSDREVCVCDVFGDDKQVVFYVHTPMGPQPPGSDYYRSTYTVDANGAYTFSDPERVRRMTSYEPVPAAGGAAPGMGLHSRSAEQRTAHQTEEDSTMDAAERKSLVDELSQNFASLLTPVKDQIAAVETAAKEAAVNAAKEAVAPVAQELAAMKEQLGQVSTSVNAERDQKRQELVKVLSSNSRTPFTEAELEAKPLAELEKLAQMAKVTSFAGRGAPRTVAANEKAEPAYAEPVPYFATNKKDEAGSSKKEGE